MNRSEDALQKSLVAWLRFNGLFVTHVPNTARRSPREGKRYRDMGMVAGYPDLIVHGQGGRTVLIEVKAPPARLKSGALSKARPRLSDDQEAILPQLAALGIPVLVARSIDDVEAALRGLGVPLRDKGRAA